jgi:hypothetical protein
MIRLRAAQWVIVLGVIFPALPVSAGDGPRWHSEQWYEGRAGDPPGARQHYKYGKYWPPFSRPTGPGQTFWHKYHHTHYWPYPYNCEDRAFVQSVVQQQANIGWETATTLHDYHFDAETNRLNSAGETHLRWILTQAPPHRRTTYVARGATNDIGQFRLTQVQQAAREITGSDSAPILLKDDSFLGRPAIEIDTLRRLELQSIPQPRLFVIGGMGGGSSSGPSSSQAGGATGQPQSGGNLIR